MNFLLIFFLLGFIGAGFKDGFIHTFGRFVGAIFGFLAARSFAIRIAGIVGFFVPSGWASLASFVVVFVIVTRLTGFVFKLADSAFKILTIIPFLKTIDKLLGAILGIVEGIVVMGGIIFLAYNFKIDPTILKWLSGSGVAQWLVSVFHILLGVLL